METKFCKHCGEKIPSDAVICTKCGRQVEDINTNTVVVNNNIGKQKDKVVALLLCIFLGGLGAHKFYEDKIGMGILYLFTGGLCGIGVLVDIITIACKSNPYYV